MKEMDFGWVVDADPPVVWLVEVSNYALDPDPDAAYDEAAFQQEVVQKVTDSAWMLLAMWAGTSIGQRLQRDVTASCAAFPTSAVAIRPALLVGLGGSDASLKLHTLTSALRPKLQGRLSSAGASPLIPFLLDRPSPAEGVPVAVERVDAE